MVTFQIYINSAQESNKCSTFKKNYSEHLAITLAPLSASIRMLCKPVALGLDGELLGSEDTYTLED